MHIQTINKRDVVTFRYHYPSGNAEIFSFSGQPTEVSIPVGKFALTQFAARLELVKQKPFLSTPDK